MTALILFATATIAPVAGAATTATTAIVILILTNPADIVLISAMSAYGVVGDCEG